MYAHEISNTKSTIFPFTIILKEETNLLRSMGSMVSDIYRKEKEKEK